MTRAQVFFGLFALTAEVKVGSFSAGMVKETGDGTARFLHSVVRGEIDAREGQSSQAKRAKDKLSDETPAENCRENAMSLVSPCCSPSLPSTS